mmetsp:Transcript_69033/g.186533  ORF Transcript_69033/g.186533 Transcript_69033/m.186533 type:complete len:244 (+) Transcript_69033:894-1625(+)
MRLGQLHLGIDHLMQVEVHVGHHDADVVKVWVRRGQQVRELQQVLVPQGRHEPHLAEDPLARQRVPGEVADPLHRHLLLVLARRVLVKMHLPVGARAEPLHVHQVAGHLQRGGLAGWALRHGHAPAASQLGGSRLSSKAGPGLLGKSPAAGGALGCSAAAASSCSCSRTCSSSACDRYPRLWGRCWGRRGCSPLEGRDRQGAEALRAIAARARPHAPDPFRAAGGGSRCLVKGGWAPGFACGP